MTTPWRVLSSLCLGAFLFLPCHRVDAEPDEHHHHHHGAPLHFSHPLIAESPSPDTKIRFDAFRIHGEEGDETIVNLEAEYAVTPAFSIEIDVPFTERSPEVGLSTSRLDNVGIGLKLANFAFADRGLLLGYGIEFGLPTGDDEAGIGSDNVFEIAPVLNLGYQHDRFELVTFWEFGIPTNQNEDEDQEVETELEGNLSFLWHVSDRLQALVEVDGETVLSGEESGESVVQITPGVKIRPWRPESLWLGLGVSTPISNNEELDTRFVASAFYHF